MRVTVGLICVGVLLSTVGTANAEILTVSNMLIAYDKAAPGSYDRSVIELTFSQEEDGIGWANAAIVSERHEPPLYCLPPNLVLTGYQIVDMLRRGMKDNSVVGGVPYGFGILLVVKKTFPCTKSPK